jgi:GAF domain-containing protein
MAGSAAAIAGLVLPLLRDLIPHSHAAIYRQEPRGQILTLLAEDGSGQPLAKLEDRLELGDLGVAFEFGPERFCPVILFLGEGPILCAVPRQLHAAGIDVLMAVPLGHHDRMLGVLLLGGTGPASFSGPQTEIAQEVGGIISLALAHSELLENVTRSRGQLSIISAPGAGAVIKASCPLIKTREEDHVP